MMIPPQFKCVFLIVVFCSHLFCDARLPAQSVKGKLVKIEVYPSCLGGVNRNDALTNSQPLKERLEKDTGHQVKLIIGNKAGRDQLEDFGKRLALGEIDFGIVWGTEYRWLKEKNNKLVPLAVVSSESSRGTELSIRSRLIVRRKDKLKLEDYRNKRLAEFESALLTDQIYRQSLELDFKPVKIYKTVTNALVAVKTNQADCAIVDANTYEKMESVHDGLTRHLNSIAKSEPFPSAVLIGIRKDENVWRKFETSFLKIHESPNGEETIRYWKFKKFSRPNDEFRKSVDLPQTPASVQRLFNAGPLFQK